MSSLEKVQIQISWLHQKPADLDVHCFHTHNENREKGWAEIILCTASP